jgi:hypothetical protein
MKKRYFFDTEFDEDGTTINLISIGIVCEDCNDIKQLRNELGNPRLPEQQDAEHDALLDARWNQQAWKFLNSLRNSKVSTFGY